MTEKLKALQLDALTGEVMERDLTPEEIEFHKEFVEQSKANDLAVQAKETSRASALAKLAALGLTEEEIAAL